MSGAGPKILPAYHLPAQGAKDSRYVNEQFLTLTGGIILLHFPLVLGRSEIVAPEVFGMSPAMPMLVLFLLLTTYSDIPAHRIWHCQEENPGVPVLYPGDKRDPVIKGDNS